jgi:hypothetical protein
MEALKLPDQKHVAWIGAFATIVAALITAFVTLYDNDSKVSNNAKNEVSLKTTNKEFEKFLVNLQTVIDGHNWVELFRDYFIDEKYNSCAGYAGKLPDKDYCLLTYAMGLDLKEILKFPGDTSTCCGRLNSIVSINFKSYETEPAEILDGEPLGEIVILRGEITLYNGSKREFTIEVSKDKSSYKIGSYRTEDRANVNCDYYLSSTT